MNTPAHPLRRSLTHPRTLIALGATLLALSAAASVGLQFWFMRPFEAQTAEGLRMATSLRDAAPIITLTCLVLLIAMTAMTWGRARSAPRLTLLAATLVALAATFAARVNVFEQMFAPMPEPTFVAAEAVDFIEPGDMVLAVGTGSDAVAYPVRLLAYHHLVHDRVGERAIVATY